MEIDKCPKCGGTVEVIDRSNQYWGGMDCRSKNPAQLSHNNARDAIAFLRRAVIARIDDEWLKEVRTFLKQATAPVA